MDMDIRKSGEEKIDKIIFADEGYDGVFGTFLRRDEDGDITIFDDNGKGDYVCIRKSDVENLINALNKAKELGW